VLHLVCEWLEFDVNPDDIFLNVELSFIVINTESSPCPPRAPSARGGHRVLLSGCRRGQRFAERLQECRHFRENS
jgi:hypothetical protein